MGRKCWESIPQKFRPLKNRLNVVISRTLPSHREENLIIRCRFCHPVYTFRNYNDVINLCYSDDFEGIVKELMCGELSEKVEKVWNIGGAEIYKLALDMDLVDQLLITKIQNECVSPVFFVFIHFALLFFLFASKSTLFFMAKSCRFSRYNSLQFFSFDADVFLTGVDWNHFQEDENARSDRMTENGIDFSFSCYRYVE